MGYAKGNEPVKTTLASDEYQEDGFNALIKEYPSGKVQRLMRWDAGVSISISDGEQTEEWPARWHYHKYITEGYVALRGMVAIATLHEFDDGERGIFVDTYTDGKAGIVEPNVVHNILVAPETLLLVYKVPMGTIPGKDWHEEKVDDSMLRSCPVSMLFQDEPNHYFEI